MLAKCNQLLHLLCNSMRYSALKPIRPTYCAELRSVLCCLARRCERRHLFVAAALTVFTSLVASGSGTCTPESCKRQSGVTCEQTLLWQSRHQGHLASQGLTMTTSGEVPLLHPQAFTQCSTDGTHKAVLGPGNEGIEGLLQDDRVRAIDGLRLSPAEFLLLKKLSEMFPSQAHSAHTSQDVGLAHWAFERHHGWAHQ